MLSQHLVVFAADFSPSRELVLGADVVHLAFESDHFGAQAELVREVFPGGGGEAAVDLP
jgi:hypothetical protein